MPKSDPIPRSDVAFNALLRTFRGGIGKYATLFELSPAQIASQAADANFFNRTLSCQTIIGQGSQSWTSFKDALRRGPVSALATVPADLVFPASVPPVPPGIEARFRALIRQIKAHANYNDGIGRGLGIEGAEQTAPDLTAVQPELEVEISGGKVHLPWGWGGLSAFLDMIELRVDRDDGRGSVLLANDTTPGYTDSTPFPEKPTKWTYTAIFWLDDRRVGRWSNPVSIIVGG